jgi:two-component system OmpR family response regulator
MILLLIDQGSSAGDVLAQRLASSGFLPHVCDSTAEAAASPLRESATALLLDQGLEAPDAAVAIAQLRAAGMAQPLVALSARDDWRERVAALDAGADDFVVKPVRSEEVAARLRAAIRRHAGGCSERLAVGDIALDLRARCAWQSGRPLALTRNEFRLLRLFALAPEGFLSKNQIADALWPGDRTISGNAVEVLVARLRQKLGTGRILTARGLGYGMDMEPPASDGPERDGWRSTG